MGQFYLALTYACNHRCLSCPTDLGIRRSPALRLSDIQYSIEQSDFAPGVDLVVLSGGEPTLHPEFLEILNYITGDLSSMVRILSNSTRFSDRRFLERVLAASHSRCAITTAFYSYSSSVHDRITQRSGSFMRTSRGLANLIASSVPISIKTIIQKLNYDHLPEIAKFVNRLFPTHVGFVFEGIDLVGQALRHIDVTGVRLPEVTPFLESALDELIGKRSILVQGVPICTVDPYYWPYFCVDSKLPTESYQSPETEMTSNVPEPSGTNTSACAQCVFEPRCPGIWYSYRSVYGISDLSPFVYLKEPMK